MFKLPHLNQILQSKWTYIFAGLLIVLLASYSYECVRFPLNGATDLPGYAAETYGISSYTVINHIDARGATFYLLDRSGSTDNILVAYPRSLFFLRYGQHIQFYTVPKDSIEVLFCQFESGILLRDFRLDPSSTTDFENLYYVIDVWTDPDVVEYSVTNSDKMESAILSKQLFPYVCIVIISRIILAILYKVISKQRYKI